MGGAAAEAAAMMRAAIDGAEGSSASPAARTFQVGLPALDDLAPGRVFGLGVVHEVLFPPGAPTPRSFALLLAMSAARVRSGCVAWCDPDGTLYPPAPGAGRLADGSAADSSAPVAGGPGVGGGRVFALGRRGGDGAGAGPPDARAGPATAIGGRNGRRGGRVRPPPARRQPICRRHTLACSSRKRRTRRAAMARRTGSRPRRATQSTPDPGGQP